MKPRLVSLAQAQRYLNGLHPSLFGIQPVKPGIYDRKAIEARLVQRFRSECFRYISAKMASCQAHDLSPNSRKALRRAERIALRRVDDVQQTLAGWRLH